MFVDGIAFRQFEYYELYEFWERNVISATFLYFSGVWSEFWHNPWRKRSPKIRKVKFINIWRPESGIGVTWKHESVYMLLGKKHPVNRITEGSLLNRFQSAIMHFHSVDVRWTRNILVWLIVAGYETEYSFPKCAPNFRSDTVGQFFRRVNPSISLNLCICDVRFFRVLLAIFHRYVKPLCHPFFFNFINHLFFRMSLALFSAGINLFSLK